MRVWMRRYHIDSNSWEPTILKIVSKQQQGDYVINKMFFSFSKGERQLSREVNDKYTFHCYRFT